MCAHACEDSFQSERAMRDPAHYGSFELPPGRPSRVRDRCPECGGAIEWVDTFADTGAGSERRWIGADAECERCGLELRWDPNKIALREARRSAAAEKYQDEAESGQLRLV